MQLCVNVARIKPWTT